MFHPPTLLRDYRPDSLPAGDLRSISLHWTGGDYETVYPAYHFVVTGPHEILVHQTHDLRDNMRDVRAEPEQPYAAHTRGRNSFSIGLSIAAMRDATPGDFGSFPLTDELVGGLCTLAARLARRYAIPLTAIRTHAEAALDDGYFGAGGDDVRWDIARLSAGIEPLVPSDAARIGDVLRTRIAASV